MLASPGSVGGGWFKKLTASDLVIRHHNYKTNGGWQVRQPEPGIWLWRSPHRRIYLVNAAGTHPLGDSGYAQKMWRAARPPQQQLDKLALPSAD